MNRSGRERRSSCADGRSVLEFGIKEEKKLLTRPASLEMRLLVSHYGQSQR